MSHHASRTLFATFAALVVALFAFAGSAWAAVEVNSADASQLESIRGIGPSLSSKILAARKQSAFRDWSDLETRVSGVGDKNSAAFSRSGLTVAGKAKEGAQATGETSTKSGGSKTATAKKSTADGGATTIASSAKK